MTRALLQQLSSHGAKVYLAFGLLKREQRANTIRVSRERLGEVTGFHAGIIRHVIGELIGFGLIETAGAGGWRLLLPPKAWMPLEGGHQKGSSPPHPPSSQKVVAAEKESKEKAAQAREPFPGGTLPPPLGVHLPPSPGLGGNLAQAPPRARPVGPTTATERLIAIALLTHAAKVLGLRTTARTPYGQRCLRGIHRNLRDGYSREDLYKAVQRAAALRKGGDKFNGYVNLLYIWGTGLDALLVTASGPFQHRTGAEAEAWQQAIAEQGTRESPEAFLRRARGHAPLAHNPE